MTEIRNAIVWAEIPVSDLSKGRSFYEAVLQKDMIEQQMGPNMTAVFPFSEGTVAGHLYEGQPAADGRGATVSLAVEGALEDAMSRVFDAGGAVKSEVIAIPAGQFFYATDPDGNSISFFKA